MKRLFSIVTLAIAVLLVTSCASPPDTTASSAAQATPSAAADQAPRQRYWVTATRVKPEMMAQFREFYLKETLPAIQKAGTKQQSVWTTASLGEGFEYITIRPLESLQQFDEPSAVAKGLGEEGFRKWNAKRGTLIVSSRSYITQERPELGIAPNADYVPKLAFVTRNSVAPGHAADYENFVKNDVLPILKKANPKGFSIRKVGLGGDSDGYISAALLDSFADYEKWTAALTKEGYGNVAAKRAGIIMHREITVYRYVPELSLRPGAQK